MCCDCCRASEASTFRLNIRLAHSEHRETTSTETHAKKTKVEAEENSSSMSINPIQENK
jgi:hypothetical protein